MKPFRISHNTLHDLSRKRLKKISPKHKEKICSESFLCQFNELSSLDNSPRIVLGSYMASNNKLVSLHGSPVFIGDMFQCCDNPLNTLSGSSQKVGSLFIVSHCLLFSVDFLPLKTAVIIL